MICFVSPDEEGKLLEFYEPMEAVNRDFMGWERLLWVWCRADIDWPLLMRSQISGLNLDANQHVEPFSPMLLISASFGNKEGGRSGHRPRIERSTEGGKRDPPHPFFSPRTHQTQPYARRRRFPRG